MNRRLFLLTASALLLLPAHALDINYLNKGADGVFAPTGESVVVDLSLATPGSWDAATPENDHGIYDAEKWAVVFKFSAVNIPAGTTVTFKNHPSRAPVVWLVEGDATIDGRVDLSGARGDGDPNRLVLSEPGPGGFRGGDFQIIGTGNVSGLGPGGAYGNPGAGRGGEVFPGNQGASYGTPGSLGWGAYLTVPTYGNSSIIPLIGGSGIGPDGNSPYFGGGAGGGAILLAASGRIHLGAAGAIRANGTPGPVGAAGGGTGGGIRLVCESLTGMGTIEALSKTYSGNGRIRLETRDFPGTVIAQPFTVAVPPRNPAQLWPEDTAPTARVVSVAGVEPPSDPRAEISFGLVGGTRNSDIPLPASSVSNLVTIETLNLPSTATVTFRVVSIPSGGDLRVKAELASVDSQNSSRLLWTNTVIMPPGYHAVQVVAVSP